MSNEVKKCNNPKPSVDYSKDEFDNIHTYCENCGREVINIKMKGEKKFHWVHAHREINIKFD